MQLEALRLFCDVADTQSFTDAARRHHCTPANASHSFHVLESELGMPLAERFLRRIWLNDTGQVLFPIRAMNRGWPSGFSAGCRLCWPATRPIPSPRCP